jgi:positive regulator of sigma E activity
VSYAVEWIPGAALAGAVLLVLIVPSFALIGLVVVALGAVAALVALAGAILATPYLLVRSLRRRVAKRRQSTQGSVPIATAIAQAASATNRSGLTALAEPTTARRSQ